MGFIVAFTYKKLMIFYVRKLSYLFLANIYRILFIYFIQYDFFMKLTQQDIARIINVTPMTLRNWRREKPKLYEIVMKGFAFEEAVKKAQENADQLKALEEKFKIKK